MSSLEEQVLCPESSWSDVFVHPACSGPAGALTLPLVSCSLLPFRGGACPEARVEDERNKAVQHLEHRSHGNQSSEGSQKYPFPNWWETPDLSLGYSRLGLLLCTPTAAFYPTVEEKGRDGNLRKPCDEKQLRSVCSEERLRRTGRSFLASHSLLQSSRNPSTYKSQQHLTRPSEPVFTFSSPPGTLSAFRFSISCCSRVISSFKSQTNIYKTQMSW